LLSLPAPLLLFAAVTDVYVLSRQLAGRRVVNCDDNGFVGSNVMLRAHY
jgi:hypothetical protein